MIWWNRPDCLTSAWPQGHGAGMIRKRYPWPVIVGLASEALIALAYARLILHRTRPEDILHRNAQAWTRAGIIERSLGDDAVRDACERVAYAITRLAIRLPWRADCLVQAIAGQRMLLTRGIASEIVVGTAKNSDGSFEAHAWLSQSGATVLGGDILRFEPLLDSTGRQA